MLILAVGVEFGCWNNMNNFSTINVRTTAQRENLCKGINCFSPSSVFFVFPKLVSEEQGLSQQSRLTAI